MQQSTSTVLPEPERHAFTSPKGITLVSSRVDQTPLLPPEAGLNLNLGSYQYDEQGSLVGSWAFLGSFVQLELTSSACQEREASYPRSTRSCGSWQEWPSWWARDAELRQGGENTTFQIPGEPSEMLQDSSDRDREGTKAFRKQASSYSADSCPKAEPREQRRLYLYII
jgi:hypothetical protein